MINHGDVGNGLASLESTVSESAAAGNPATIATRAEAPLAVPRGRRMLLDVAVEAEAARDDATRETSLGYAILHAADGLEPADRRRLLFTFSADGSSSASRTARPEFSATEVAECLGRVQLSEPTDEQLLDALVVAVDTARYWQEPDGEDVLAAQPEVVAQLRRVAEAVAGSPHTDWWFTPTAEDRQLAVQWEGTMPIPPLTEHSEALNEARQAQIVGEARARRERPEDPAESWSGNWWSNPRSRCPPQPVRSRAVRRGPAHL